MIEYLEIRLYTNSAATAWSVLPDFTSMSFDKKYNDIGAINFSYPYMKAKLLGIKDQSLVGVVLGYSDGTEKEVERYILHSTSNEKVSDGTRFMEVSGRSIFSILEDAVVYPSNWPVTAPSGHEFIEQNPGTIWRTLILRAKNRGVFPNLVETSFSGTADSAGQAWAMQLSQTFQTGTSYVQAFSDMQERGVVDARIVGWNLEVYNGGTLGRHIDIGTLEVRPAKNVTEMVINTDSSESCSVVLIEGEEGTAVERADGNAQGLLGRRRERYVSQGGIADAGVLSILGDAELGLYAKIPAEETVGVTDFDTLEAFKDFDASDWVWVRYEGDEASVERRIRQIAVSVDQDRNLQIGLTLNSILYEEDIKLRRRIESYTGGGGGYGPQPNRGLDTVPPQAPASLQWASDAYVDQMGKTVGVVNLDWTDVTLNEDGTALDDLSHYEVWQRTAPNGKWHRVTVTDPSDSFVGLSPYEPGSLWDFRVRAVDDSDNKSNWSPTALTTIAADTTPPPVPSTFASSARLGVVILEWDGKSSTGGEMGADFSHIEVHVGTASTFTPTTATYVDRLTGPGMAYVADLPYNQTRYFRAVAYDFSGNASAPSTAAAQSVTPLVNTDLIGQVIAGANIQDGTIAAYDKIIGNTITGGHIQGLAISAGHIQSNAITADKITAGAITAIKIGANQVTADKISSNAIDGKTISGVTINGGVFKSTNYSQRIEMGNTGFNDPVDEVRMFNNGTVVSMRHLTGDAGRLYFSMPGTALSAYYTSDGWLGIQRGTGNPMLKILGTASGVQSRNGSDSGYLPMGASEFNVSSNMEFKTSVEPVQVDTKAVLAKNGLRKWKWDAEFLGLEALRNAPEESFVSEADVINEARSKKLNPQQQAAFRKQRGKALKAEAVAEAEAAAAKDVYGLVADDLPTWLRNEDGYSVTAVTAFLWEALKQIDARLTALETQ